jgi:enamine deaminase RidA (YjgF/YER057c/UK114 family)
VPIGENQPVKDARRPAVSGLYPDAPYDYVAVAPLGALLFTAGACPLDEDGNVVGLRDHRAQAIVTVENLRRALAHFEAGFDNLVKTTVYVVGDRDHLVAVWNVVADSLAPHRPPSTLLGVSTLGYPGQLVEIEAIAAVHSKKGT